MAEIIKGCRAGNYGTPFCWYPWYAYSGADRAFTNVGYYPGTSNDFGQALQFQRTENCVSPNGPFAQYCSTVVK